jgi:hypothetical protein
MRTIERRREKHWRRRHRNAEFTGYQAFYLDMWARGRSSRDIDVQWRILKLVVREELRALKNQRVLTSRIFREYP